MKLISLSEDVKHFMLYNIIYWIPQHVSKIAIHALLTVGPLQGWRIFKKHIK